MGFPRTPSSNVPFDAICSLDTAIAPIEVDFETILKSAGVEDEPQFGEFIEDDKTPVAVNRAYSKAISVWGKKVSAVLRDWFLPSEDARQLKLTKADFKHVEGRATVEAMVKGMKMRARWERYCQSGDEKHLMPWVEGEEPVRFTLNQLAEPDKVHVVGVMEAGTSEGDTQYKHVYELSLWVLRRTLRNVTPWPAVWGELKHEGEYLSEESLRKIPHEVITQLEVFLMDTAELWETEKKA